MTDPLNSEKEWQNVRVAVIRAIDKLEKDLGALKEKSSSQDQALERRLMQLELKAAKWGAIAGIGLAAVYEYVKGLVK